MTLGNKIQEIRSARGMSQEQFGGLNGSDWIKWSVWSIFLLITEMQRFIR